MKCVVVVVCGLGEEPREDLGGKTPLEVARTPVLDAMAARGILGLARTVPRNASPGCEVGAAALLGYDPAHHLIGAAALEAMGLGVTLGPADVALRANLVTLDTTEDGTEILRDPLGGRLPITEAAELARDLAAAIQGTDLSFVPGLGHRHILVWRGGETAIRTTSPYELVDKPVSAKHPSGARSEILVAAMERMRDVLASHPVCAARRARAERVPTTVWPYAPAQRGSLPALRDAFGVEGAMIATAPLARGLGVAAGLDPIVVAGATGDVDTNFGAEAEAAVIALARYDLVAVHVAAADFAAHAGDAQRKIVAIERFDEAFLGPLLGGLRQMGGDWRLLVAGDHSSSCATRMHGPDPAPFCVFTPRDETKARGQKRVFSERDARDQGVFIQEAYTLLDRLVRH